MGLKLPEEMRLRQGFLSLPDGLLPVLALGPFSGGGAEWCL